MLAHRAAAQHITRQQVELDWMRAHYAAAQHITSQQTELGWMRAHYAAVRISGHRMDMDWMPARPLEPLTTY